MSDRTVYLVEVYDPANNWGDRSNDEDNWGVLTGTAHDTFPLAEAEIADVTSVYRSVRIKKVVNSIVATYKDGVPNG